MPPKSQMPDFQGWATKYNIPCSDGRTILPGAFQHQDNMTVPLVYQHGGRDVHNVLGKVSLSHRNDGVYAKGFFNDSSAADAARSAVKHGDITQMSIHANRLREDHANVKHGEIVEVSLVLKGANRGAVIEDVFMHSGLADDEDAVIIHSGIAFDALENVEKPEPPPEKEETIEHADGEGPTVGEVFNTLTDVQKDAVYMIIGSLTEDNSDAQEGDDVSHSVFEPPTDEPKGELTHDELAKYRSEVLADIPKYGSLKSSILTHSFSYGISDPTILFPDAKAVANEPTQIRRDQSWVGKLLGGSTHLPYARFKSRYSNLTGAEIRARGYVTAAKKLDTVYTILGRETGPTTVYVKTRLDRDTELDITDFDMMSWLRAQMRVDLNEELARAFLLGDGRDTSSPDKIIETKIRPVVSDDDLYSYKVSLSSEALAMNDADRVAEEIVYALEQYKGKGTPALWADTHTINRMLWARDKDGNRIYRSRQELADGIGVSELINVPLLKNHQITVQSGKKPVFGVLLDPSDYNVGTNKGGEITPFDDFDIDYNQRKALLETRLSGALRDPRTAVILLGGITGAQVPTPETLPVVP